MGEAKLSSDTDEHVEPIAQEPEAEKATDATQPAQPEEVAASEESQDTEPTEPSEEQKAAQRRERLSAIAEHIRSDSGQVRLTDPAVFLAEPFSMDEDDLDEAWAEMAGSDEFRDIIRTRDEKTGITYVHSEVLLTAPYAKLMLRTAANDPVYLIVETVRDESKIYPRPTAATFFEYEPFNLVLDDVLVHVETILATEGYSDIKVIHPSNGATYLFSDRYMDEDHALPMAQWVEVDMHLPSNQ